MEVTVSSFRYSAASASLQSPGILTYRQARRINAESRLLYVTASSIAAREGNQPNRDAFAERAVDQLPARRYRRSVAQAIADAVGETT